MPNDDGTLTPDEVMLSGAEPSNGKTAFGVAGMGFSILGGLLKGMAAIQAGGFNAGISRHNAQLADIAQGDSMARGHAAAGYALLRGSTLVGKQKAAYAGAGVSASSGSVADTTASTSLMSDLDARIIENNAMREAWGFKNQAQNFRQRAEIQEATGRQQAVGEILGGVTTASGYAAKMIGIA